MQPCFSASSLMTESPRTPKALRERLSLVMWVHYKIFCLEERSIWSSIMQLEMVKESLDVLRVPR